MIKALLAEGFSHADVEVIMKIAKANGLGGEISKMKNGTVKFYNDNKGVGIIQTESGEEFEFRSRIFLRIGDKVIFEIHEKKKGLNAVNVKLV